MPRIAIVIAIGVLAASSCAANTPDGTESRRYIRSVVGLSFLDVGATGGTLICDRTGVGFGLGGACFTLHGGESAVTLSALDDLSPARPVLEVWFLDAQGDIIDTFGWVVCGEATLQVPPDAASVVAHLQHPLPECRDAGEPTQGVIEARFVLRIP